MSVQAHRCIQKGCTGFVLFDDADFNYSKALNNPASGLLDTPCCNICGKEYQVVVSHMLIEVDQHGIMVDELPSCCFTEYEASKRMESTNDTYKSLFVNDSYSVFNSNEEIVATFQTAERAERVRDALNAGFCYSKEHGIMGQIEAVQLRALSIGSIDIVGLKN